MKSRLAITSMILLMSQLSFGQADQNPVNQYQIIYEADRDGNRISGSLEKLIELVDSGNPVRVGWELVSRWPDTVTVMRHWTDGGFVTTLRGHVFAQIPAIFGQGFSHIDSPPGIFLSTDIPDSWVAVVGTNGTLVSKFQKQEWMKEVPEEELKKDGTNESKNSLGCHGEVAQRVAGS